MASFVDGLEAKARDGCEHVIGAVDSGSPYYLGGWLEAHRNVTHHYPKMHPAAGQYGQEEMANALAKAADLESTIDSGERFGDARFRYADEVGVQLLPPIETSPITRNQTTLRLAAPAPHRRLVDLATGTGLLLRQLAACPHRRARRSG